MSGPTAALVGLPESEVMANFYIPFPNFLRLHSLLKNIKKKMICEAFWYSNASYGKACEEIKISISGAGSNDVKRLRQRTIDWTPKRYLNI